MKNGSPAIVYTPCPIGECATSLTNGNKRCPLALEQFIYFDPTSEVCNPVSACTNPQTPYAQNPDGTINLDGICVSGSTCNCINQQECPVFSEVMFTVTENGNYTQTPGGNVLTGGISFTPAGNQTCTLDTQSLSKLGCVTPTLTCIQSNPCVQGVLTLIPPLGVNPETFANSVDRFNAPVTCMPAPPCPAGLSVYDYSTNSAICAILN